jgi:hypothetical protein
LEGAGRHAETVPRVREHRFEGTSDGSDGDP